MHAAACVMEHLHAHVRILRSLGRRCGCRGGSLLASWNPAGLPAAGHAFPGAAHLLPLLRFFLLIHMGFLHKQVYGSRSRASRRRCWMGRLCPARRRLGCTWLSRVHGGSRRSLGADWTQWFCRLGSLRSTTRRPVSSRMGQGEASMHGPSEVSRAQRSGSHQLRAGSHRAWQTQACDVLPNRR